MQNSNESETKDNIKEQLYEVESEMNRFRYKLDILPIFIENLKMLKEIRQNCTETEVINCIDKQIEKTNIKLLEIVNKK